MPNMTEDARTALAERVMKTLVSLWLDQNGIDAEVTIREVNHREK